jgi:hypothetical protein
MNYLSHLVSIVSGHASTSAVSGFRADCISHSLQSIGSTAFAGQLSGFASEIGFDLTAGVLRCIGAH